MLKLIRVTNPLLPAEGRIERELEHTDLQTLDVYLASETTEACAVSLNGRIWPQEQWTKIRPVDGDSIVIAPIVEGGSFLRTLASVAVVGASIAAYFFLGPLGPLTNMTASLIAGAISAVGGALVNIFMGPAPPSTKAETPSYAFNGPTTLAQAGSPIPKAYGRFLSGGCVIEQFTDVEGQNTYINALVCYGFGPALSLNQLELNGKDVSLYQNVDYYFRTGTNNQTPVQGFGRIVNGYAQDTKCISGQPVIVPGTGTQTQALQVDVQFPVGVFRTDDSGNVKTLVITYLVEYSVAGANDWQPVLQPQNTHDLVTYNSNGTESYPYWSAVATDLPAGSGVVYSTDSDSGAHYVGEPWNETQTVEVFQPNGNHSTYSRLFQGEWMKTDPTLNQVVVDTWSQGYVEYLDNRTSVLYNRTSIYGLAPNKYDVRITKYGSAPQHNDVSPGDNENPRTGEQVWVHNVNEITFRTLAYPNMVLVGVRALATNQLSGGNPQILADITFDASMPMPAELAAFPHDNPACIAVDMMTSPVYGGGADITLANIEPYIDQWVSWGDLNEELVPDGDGGSVRRHPFNGVFDTDESLWAQLSKVGQMSRASLLQIGANYGVFVDQAEAPVQMFSMGNIVKDSFQMSWLALDDRATQVDVEFADYTRSYRTDSPVTAIDPADIDNGVILKPTRIKLVGCTVPAQAWHNANFRLQTAKKLLTTGTFTTGMAGIACRPGNVIVLQHDVPSWGYGGRTLPGSTQTTLVLDRDDLPFIGGSAYNVLVLQPSVLRYIGTIGFTDIRGGVCTLSVTNYDGLQRVTRMVINGEDRAITGSGNGILTVEGSTVFGAPNAAYQLYDTDVMDTQAVAGLAGNVATLSTPLQADPGPFATYIYGQAGREATEVRVVAIRRSDETHCQIEWQQYDPDIYNDGVPVIGATIIGGATAAAVTDLLLTESNVLQSGGYATYAQLSWKNGQTTVGVEIYGSVDDGPERFLDRVVGGTTYRMQVAPADSWFFRVVGYDSYDNFGPMQTAPTATILSNGPIKNLVQGADFAAGFAYWGREGRPQDLMVTSSANTGEVVYTVQDSTFVAPPPSQGEFFLYQTLSPEEYQAGQWLLISAYLSASSGCTGDLVLRLEIGGTIYDTGTGTDAALHLTGAAAGPTRVVGKPQQVPDVAGTEITVQWLFVQSTLSQPNIVPSGAVFTMDHPMVEIVSGPSVTTPSPWSQTDVLAQVGGLTAAGSSTALRAQASISPLVSGTIAYQFTDTGITYSWASLTINWRDGGQTYIKDGAILTTGLAASTQYCGFLYYDVVLGVIALSMAGADSGTPAQLFSAYNPTADAACYMDGQVPLTPGGLFVTTQATPASGTAAPPPGTGSGGGNVGGGYRPNQPASQASAN